MIVLGGLLCAFDGHPLSGFGRLEDGVADVLGAEGVAEIGVGFFGRGVI